MAHYPAKAPLGTFLINLSGAFLLGLSAWCVRDEAMRLLVADGFLGAYTTFSTLMFEGFVFVQEGRRRFATAYLAGSVLVGVAAYGIGQAIGLLFGR